jgi:hypothetical protein
MPAVDELDLVRQLLDGPGPRTGVTASGRARREALAARAAAEPTAPQQRGSRRPAVGGVHRPAGSGRVWRSPTVPRRPPQRR